MSENERIREVRKSLRLTTTQFGRALGISNSAVSNIENGVRGVTDQMRRSICREYNVREEWLQTGEGEMFRPDPAGYLDGLVEQYGLGRRERVFIEKLLALKPDARNAAIDFLEDVVQTINTEARQEKDETEDERIAREVDAEMAELRRQRLAEKRAAAGLSGSGYGNSGTGIA